MQQQSLLRGACAGLMAGLAASWIMNRFQAVLGSSGGTDDEPATAKAAERVSTGVLGHRLDKDEKNVAASAVHYAMGGLSGAAYGAAADSIPLAASAGGALFGTALWLVADEIAVPALRLSRPPADYPASTHLSALAAHIVYGVSTGVLARELLRASDAKSETLRRAAVIGAITGLRSMSGMFFLSRESASAFLPLRGNVFDLLRSEVAANGLAVLAAGELVADKLPFTPDRTSPAPLAFRAVAGGFCGAAIFAAADEPPTAGIVIGAACAVAAAFAGYYLRREIVKRGVPDLLCALAEDAVVVSGGMAGTAAAR